VVDVWGFFRTLAAMIAVSTRGEIGRDHQVS
jgi:hypothetical protein